MQFFHNMYFPTKVGYWSFVCSWKCRMNVTCMSGEGMVRMSQKSGKEERLQVKEQSIKQGKGYIFKVPKFRRLHDEIFALILCHFI